MSENCYAPLIVFFCGILGANDTVLLAQDKEDKPKSTEKNQCGAIGVWFPSAYDPLAQLAEQLPFKQWVWSSNLQRVTKKHPGNNAFLGCFSLFYELFWIEKLLRSDRVTNLLLTAKLPSFCVSALRSSILRCV